MTAREKAEKVAGEILKGSFYANYEETKVVREKITQAILDFNEEQFAERGYAFQEAQTKSLTKIAELQAERDRLREVLQKNREWWESFLKHRHYLSDYDLRHQIDVCDEALVPLPEGE